MKLSKYKQSALSHTSIMSFNSKMNKHIFPRQGRWGFCNLIPSFIEQVSLPFLNTVNSTLVIHVHVQHDKDAWGGIGAGKFRHPVQ